MRCGGGVRRGRRGLEGGRDCRVYGLCGVFMVTWAGVYDEIDFNDTPSVEINIFFIFIHMDQFMIHRPVTD